MSKQHFDWFNKTSLRWKYKSKWVGYSSVCYIFPAILLKEHHAMFRLVWIIQAIVSYASDYKWSGVTHWSHGIDRIWATVLVLTTMIIASYFFFFMFKNSNYYDKKSD